MVSISDSEKKDTHRSGFRFFHVSQQQHLLPFRERASRHQSQSYPWESQDHTSWRPTRTRGWVDPSHAPYLRWRNIPPPTALFHQNTHSLRIDKRLAVDNHFADKGIEFSTLNPFLFPHFFSTFVIRCRASLYWSHTLFFSSYITVGKQLYQNQVVSRTDIGIEVATCFREFHDSLLHQRERQKQPSFQFRNRSVLRNEALRWSWYRWYDWTDAKNKEKTVRVRCMRDGEDSCGIGTSRTHRYSPCRGNKSTCRLFSLIYFPRAFLILDHTSALYDPIVVVGAVQSKLRPISTGIVRSYSLESCSRNGPHRRHFWGETRSPFLLGIGNDLKKKLASWSSNPFPVVGGVSFVSHDNLAYQMNLLGINIEWIGRPSPQVHTS